MLILFPTDQFLTEKEVRACTDICLCSHCSYPTLPVSPDEEKTMKKIHLLFSIILLTSLALAACGGDGQKANDLLSQIQERGTLLISTDPAYPPQSALKADPQRTPGTKCAADQSTLGELEGFDIDTAAAIADALGVEPCFLSIDWGIIISGNWAGRFDISVGSVSITPERARVLYFGQPYYAVPAAVFVHQENTSYLTPADLSGKRIGVCGGCTYESFLNTTLVIPGEELNFMIANADIKTYDTDSTALEDLSLGDGVRLDAVLTAQPTGLTAIANGRPIKQLGDPVFFEFNAPAIDRNSLADPASFLAKVNEIIQGLHQDGTLLALSQSYYGGDYTTAAADYVLGDINK
jgi:polar amino acid transport system substrate-binding protein